MWPRRATCPEPSRPWWRTKWFPKGRYSSILIASKGVSHPHLVHPQTGRSGIIYIRMDNGLESPQDSQKVVNGGTNPFNLN